ncbi:MAG: hypothetical protein HKN14_14500 [Marinicaulis sp.]|nr:hypothetical protein [Marinicaulis sp.]
MEEKASQRYDDIDRQFEDEFGEEKIDAADEKALHEEKDWRWRWAQETGR